MHAYTHPRQLIAGIYFIWSNATYTSSRFYKLVFQHPQVPPTFIFLDLEAVKVQVETKFAWLTYPSGRLYTKTIYAALKTLQCRARCSVSCVVR
jgi:hypothetical protein